MPDTKSKPKQGMGETIALIVTGALVLALCGFGGVLCWQVVSGSPPDPGLKDLTRDLVLLFAVAWRTNFAGSTTVTAEQANVSSGGGSPAPANVENMVVTGTATEQPPAVGNGAGAG